MLLLSEYLVKPLVIPLIRTYPIFMAKKNKKTVPTPLAEGRAITDRRSGKKRYKGSEHRTPKRLGRREEDALAAKVHVVSLSIVLTLLTLHGLIILFHEFMPELFK